LPHANARTNEYGRNLAVQRYLAGHRVQDIAAQLGIGRTTVYKGTTCAQFLHRAAQWFHDTHGITIRRVLTDNAKSYRLSKDWIAVCHTLQIRRRFTKPGCPWTNGKAERFNRTLLTEWVYAQPWTSTAQRAAAFDAFLDRYNTRRAHTAAGGRPPITRLAA
jgi:transposase InsO family protein